MDGFIRWYGCMCRYLACGRGEWGLCDRGDGVASWVCVTWEGGACGRDGGISGGMVACVVSWPECMLCECGFPKRQMVKLPSRECLGTCVLS